METLFFYFGVILICMFLVKMAVRKNQKRWLFAAVVLFSFVAGCRDVLVGTDTEMVVTAMIRDMSRSTFSHSKDWLYYFLCKLLMTIWHNPSFVLTVYAVVTNGAVLLRLWDFKEKISLPIAVSLYGMFYFGLSMNILRQMLAVALVFYFSRYLFTNQYKRFCLGAMAVILIHASASITILLLLVYLFYFDFPGTTRFRLNRNQFAVLGISISLVLCFFLGLQYHEYIKFSGIHIGVMYPVMCTLLIIAYIVSGKVNFSGEIGNDYEKNFKFVFILSLLGYIISFAGYFMTDLGRFSYYFKIYEIVFYGMIMKQERLDLRIKVSVMVVLFLIGMYSLKVYGGIVPYQFIWQG